ncbi:hypothetical protein HH310_31435 [Actinoplanes sp. TBRC 11911]|uniref:hypothetical protein n=1 Tax=Actinoplanes sp. TBRC 11911 TaxID=2729386 RepID=UPI00145F18FE|nr:hypothetical protein [Actinoplanes sp. TBRC 11911]NMO55684.1 hypothetical protein [Actinoplanes sp. TBRC 11911]
MSTPEEQLREAFQAHESLAPDPAAVYARVQELSRTYKWRRRGAAAAGGLVVGAGLIAGIVTVPNALHSAPAVNHQPAATAPASPSPTPSLSAAEIEQATQTYLSAGYDLNSARQLAQLWHMSGDIGDVKVKAGRMLLQGEELPVPPSVQTGDPKLDAFASAGYDYDDATELAKLWKLQSPDDAKIEGGKRLLAGQTLPIKPGSATSPADQPPTLEEKRVKAFFDAGYTASDANKLAGLWHTPGPYEAKVEGGKRLLAGQKLPIAP